MRCVIIAALLAVSAGVSAPTFAHPGGLNGEGCHNNRRTGDYHCHRSGARARSSQFARSSSGGGGRSVSGPFANCDAARAAGVAPVLAGTPGYAPKLDRDGDGIGCE